MHERMLAKHRKKSAKTDISKVVTETIGHSFVELFSSRHDKLCNVLYVSYQCIKILQIEQRTLLLFNINEKWPSSSVRFVDDEKYTFIHLSVNLSKDATSTEEKKMRVQSAAMRGRTGRCSSPSSSMLPRTTSMRQLPKKVPRCNSSEELIFMMDEDIFDIKFG